MTEALRPDDSSSVPWVTSELHVPVPDTSMLPDRDQAAPAPGGTRARAAEIRTGALRAAGIDWLDRLRSAVRSRPLGSVAAALALGLVAARLRR